MNNTESSEGLVNTLIAVQVASTLALVGLIWFVQVVHYPMLRDRGGGRFERVHAEHSTRTGLVVVPLMLAELATAILLVVLAEGRILDLARVGLALVLVAWTSTALLQVPLHGVLARGWNAAAHRRLVRTNWIRTGAWTVRGFLVLLLASGSLAAPAAEIPAATPTVNDWVHPEVPPATEPAPAGDVAAPPVLYRV